MVPAPSEPSRTSSSRRFRAVVALTEAVVARGGCGLVAFFRFGFVAKAALYLTLGVLAMRAALGEPGGRILDVPGGLVAIAEQQPFGRGVVLLIAIGLLGHAALRSLQAVLDPERRGPHVGVRLVRLGEAGTALGHTLLAVAAFELVAGVAAPVASDRKTRELSAELLAVPLGDTLLIALGAGISLVGLSIALRGIFVGDVCERLDLERSPRIDGTLASLVIRLGLLSQGLLFFAVGLYIALAGWDRRPSEARGPAGALRGMHEIPYGRLWLAVFAVGLCAVGVSCLIEARYRRIPLPRGRFDP